MAHLVEDDLADRAADVLVGAADALDGLPVDDDDVRQDAAVSSAPLRVGKAVVETQERSRPGAVPALGRLILDEDGDVAEMPLEPAGEAPQGLLDEDFKPAAIQGASPSAPQR
jgi:hypothetical protein